MPATKRGKRGRERERSEQRRKSKRREQKAGEEKDLLSSSWNERGGRRVERKRKGEHDALSQNPGSGRGTTPGSVLSIGVGVSSTSLFARRRRLLSLFLLRLAALLHYPRLLSSHVLTYPRYPLLHPASPPSVSVYHPCPSP